MASGQWSEGVWPTPRPLALFQQSYRGLLDPINTDRILCVFAWGIVELDGLHEDPPQGSETLEFLGKANVIHSFRSPFPYNEDQMSVSIFDGKVEGITAASKGH